MQFLGILVGTAMPVPLSVVHVPASRPAEQHVDDAVCLAEKPTPTDPELRTSLEKPAACGNSKTKLCCLAPLNFMLHKRVFGAPSHLRVKRANWPAFWCLLSSWKRREGDRPFASPPPPTKCHLSLRGGKKPVTPVSPMS